METATATTDEFKSRSVDINLLSKEQREGVGAKVRRTIGRPELRKFDPFLMLDEFNVSHPGGFPDHPHRGFETVTYMYPHSKGSFCHEDFKGHKGIIRPGDLQWMTAGKGILHAEMPYDNNPGIGLQLWINLPSNLKMTEPRYQELPAEKLTRVTKDGVTAIVIAGEALGAKSPVYTHVPVHYIHFIMEKKSKLTHAIPESFNAFMYIISGTAQVGGTKTLGQPHHVMTLDRNGKGLIVETGDSTFEFVLVSGEPIGEPVVQHGPFVMNTQEEIRQTFEDYQLGQNGFENAHEWLSEISSRNRR